jgi:hypothetical protein
MRRLDSNHDRPILADEVAIGAPFRSSEIHNETNVRR